MNSFHGGMANGPWRIIRSILAALLLLTTTVSAGAISTPTTNNPVPADLADTGSSGLDLHTPPPSHPTGPELYLPPPAPNDTTVTLAVITDPSLRWSHFDTPSAWEPFTIPLSTFVSLPTDPTLSHLSGKILAAAIPAEVTCATFSSENCDGTRRSGRKGEFHCAFNLLGGGEMMRWGVPTRPKCMLCLRSDGVVEGKRVYDRFEVEMCEPHEDMVKKRVRERKERERERERGGERGQKVLG